MRSRSPFLLAVLLCCAGGAGCFPAPLDETGKRCSDLRPCGPGYVCLQGGCARPMVEAPDGGVPVAGVLVPRGASWRFTPGTSDPGGGWTGISFDDSGWASGAAPVGYGEERIRSRVDLRVGGAVTLYARTRFELPGPPDGGPLLLRVEYDDGFVAYLNGHELSRRNVRTGQTWSTLASDGHEADGFETFDVTPDMTELRVGMNVLSIEVHNFAVDSSDAYLDAELSVGVR